VSHISDRISPSKGYPSRSSSTRWKTPEAARVTNNPERNRNIPIDRTIQADNRVTSHHPLKRFFGTRI
jgi:hypothetical protein